MSRRISHKWIISALLVLCPMLAHGQVAYGTYTPYSIYGVGDLSQPGSAYSKTMGGTGVAVRNNRFLNLINPAAVTARDSLAFMADFSLYSDNKMFEQQGIKSASNTFNINDLAMSFPIWRSSAMMVGVMPYSDTGFGYSFAYADPELIGHTGNITYAAIGEGSLYKAFAAAGVTFFKRLSLGVQWNYYFGNIEKTYSTTFNDASYNGVLNGTTGKLAGSGFKFGIQYEQPVGPKHSLIVGATYTTAVNLKGTMESYRYSAGSAASDTLYYKLDQLGVDSKVRLASEIAVGVSFQEKGRWIATFDYSRSDWTGCGLDGTRGFTASKSFSATTSQTFRAGFEIVPNRNDIRYYFNHVAYRVGAYHKTEYFLLNGKQVASTGITLGVTLPIVNNYNGFTLGVDFGQRGSLTGDMIRERYINFSIGFNLFDIWFRKPRYE
jgi:hypothetical protein